MGQTQLTKRAKLSSKQTSGAVFIFAVTALDTTWRIFVPTLIGVFLGIGLDAWLRTAPVATIVCLLLGFTLSTVLIIRQLTNVRKPL